MEFDAVRFEEVGQVKRILLAAFVVFVAVAAWRIGSRLSADAVGMAVGVLFGVIAGVPASLLVLASSRRRDEGRGRYQEENRRLARYQGAPYGGGYYPQPPVIVVTGNQPMQAAAQGPRGTQYALPAPYEATIDAREFKVVGEREGWIDEW